jgi:UDP-2,3-diacylglucosamine pyrophosphatase LpxH
MINSEYKDWVDISRHFWFDAFMHIFIADLHLRPGNIADEALFTDWLGRFNKADTEIYILGDLFEYWYSGIEPGVSNVLDAIRLKGARILSGNRDFLMMSSGRVPGLIRNEELKISIYGKEYLLAHGHSLTTHDLGFGLLHSLGWPILRFLDRRLKTESKEKIARAMIKASSAIRPLSSEIKPDICAWKGVDTVICGHLHRGIMREDLIVLPAFADQRAWLEIDEKGRRFLKLS